jgi:hypothetical protein
MKKKSIFMLIALFFVSGFSFAQSCTGLLQAVICLVGGINFNKATCCKCFPTNAACTTAVPINGGLIFLLVAGLALGIYMIVKMDKKAATNNL